MPTNLTLSQARHRIRYGAAIWLCMGCCGAADTVPEPQKQLLLSSDAYAIQVIDQDLRGVLQEFGAGLGIPVTVSAEVDGRVANLRGDFTAQEFLNKIAADQSLAWFFDGDTLHVTEARQNRSLVIDFEIVDPGRLDEMLNNMGVMNTQFPIRQLPGGQMGVLIAPPRYVELVEKAFMVLTNQWQAPATVQRSVARSQILVIRGDGAQLWRGARAMRVPLNAVPELSDAPQVPTAKPAEEETDQQTVSEAEQVSSEPETTDRVSKESDAKF